MLILICHLLFKIKREKIPSFFSLLIMLFTALTLNVRRTSKYQFSLLLLIFLLLFYSIFSYYFFYAGVRHQHKRISLNFWWAAHKTKQEWQRSNANKSCAVVLLALAHYFLVCLCVVFFFGGATMCACIFLQSTHIEWWIVFIKKKKILGYKCSWASWRVLSSIVSSQFILRMRVSSLVPIRMHQFVLLFCFLFLRLSSRRWMLLRSPFVHAYM